MSDMDMGFGRLIGRIILGITAIALIAFATTSYMQDKNAKTCPYCHQKIKK